MYEPCVACLSELTREDEGACEHFRISCPICGDYTLVETPTTIAFRRDLESSAIPRFALSHRIRQMALHREWPLVTDDLIRRVCEDPSLPNPAEQADNLVLALGALHGPGRSHSLSARQWCAFIGADSGEGAIFIIEALDRSGMLRSQSTANELQLRLTFEGWQRYQELSRSRVISRRAFMAMPFGYEDLDQVYGRCFKPAVALAGFELHRVDEDSGAGLIDDHIRVAILTARFVIADLTHGNNGAYWEAGFAEGMRKPVIYTCEREYFGKHRTHFDTRNRNTVVWSALDLEQAATLLKNCIRATLPDEAILEDAPPD